MAIPYHDRQSGEYGQLYLGESSDNECVALGSIRYDLTRFVEHNGFDMFYNAEEVEQKLEELQPEFKHDCIFKCYNYEFVVNIDNIDINRVSPHLYNLILYFSSSSQLHLQEYIIGVDSISDIIQIIRNNLIFQKTIQLPIIDLIDIETSFHVGFRYDISTLFDQLLSTLESYISSQELPKLQKIHFDYSVYLYRHRKYLSAIEKIKKADALILKIPVEKLAHSKYEIEEFKGYYYESMGNDAENIYDQMDLYESSLHHFQLSYNLLNSSDIRNKKQSDLLEIKDKTIQMLYTTGNVNSALSMVNNTKKKTLDLLNTKIRIFLKNYKFTSAKNILDHLVSTEEGSIDYATNIHLARYFQYIKKFKESIKIHNKIIALKNQANEIERLPIHYFHLGLIYYELNNQNNYHQCQEKLNEIFNEFPENLLLSNYIDVLNLLKQLNSIDELQIPVLFIKWTINKKLDYELRKLVIAIIIKLISKFSNLKYNTELINDIIKVTLHINSLSLYSLVQNLFPNLQLITNNSQNINVNEYSLLIFSN